MTFHRNAENGNIWSSECDEKKMLGEFTEKMSMSRCKRLEINFLMDVTAVTATDFYEFFLEMKFQFSKQFF